MAARSTGCPIGPVPFKDVCGDGDDDPISVTEEYADIISSLPIVTAGLVLHHYQGTWLVLDRVRGVLSFQRRFTPRRGDVLLASAPKCGTTWLKALCFATMARAAYPAAGPEHPLLRLNPHECVPFLDELFSAGQEGKLEALPSLRLMNTHMQHQVLPASVLAKVSDCKIVYVCREPKDMVVSTWHFVRTVVPSVNFSKMFEFAYEGTASDGPIWDHVLGYWRASKASPERVMFLRYEEMLLDPVATVRALARFLGVPFSAAEEAAGSPADIAKLCSLETLKGATANKTGSTGVFVKFPHQAYFRKGVVGDWVNYMTPEMAQRFDSILEEKLGGSGLTFHKVTATSE